MSSVEATSPLSTSKCRLLAFVTAAQPYEQTLQTLLPVENQVLLFVILRNIEIAEAQRCIPVFDEFSPANSARCLPHQ